MERLPVLATRDPFTLAEPEVTDTESPDADLPEARATALDDPVVRVRAPPAAETLSVRIRLPLEAVREMLPAEDVIAPAVSAPELVEAVTELPFARTAPVTDETFMVTDPEPPFRFTELPADMEPPVTMTAPAVVELSRMLELVPVALSEAPP